MYGIFTYIYHTNQPNVGKYTIPGSYGIVIFMSPKTWWFIHLQQPGFLNVSNKRSHASLKSKCGTYISQPPLNPEVEQLYQV